MGGECGMCGAREMYSEFGEETPKKRENYKNLGADGMTVLIWI